jgi:hypothetical protein
MQEGATGFFSHPRMRPAKPPKKGYERCPFFAGKPLHLLRIHKLGKNYITEYHTIN